MQVWSHKVLHPGNMMNGKTSQLRKCMPLFRGWLSYAIRDDLRTGSTDTLIDPKCSIYLSLPQNPRVFFFKPGIFFTKKQIICSVEVFRLDADGLLAIGTGHFDCGLCSWCR